jgi:hypothetical protein
MNRPVDGPTAAAITLTIIGAICAFAVTFALGVSLGKVDMRGEYRQCIELGAPQQNCIDKFLGKKQ